MKVEFQVFYDRSLKCIGILSVHFYLKLKPSPSLTQEVQKHGFFYFC